MHFCGLKNAPLSKGNFRHKMTTIVGNSGQLLTSTLSPHLLSPHLDFPEYRTDRESGLTSAIFGFLVFFRFARLSLCFVRFSFLFQGFLGVQ